MSNLLVKMQQGDKFADVHPSNVDDMLAHGWVIVQDPEPVVKKTEKETAAKQSFKSKSAYKE